MEAAKLPNEFNKPYEENYKDTNKFILLEPYENKNYSISVNKTENNIKIEAYQVESLNTYYKVELNLNEFYQLSKGFKMYDNLDDICDELINIFISKKVSILKKGLNLFLILKVSLMSGKEQEINIELNSETTTDNYYTNTNNIKINQLENEIKELKNDKNILLKKINELENKIDIQNKKIENLENMIYNQNNKIDKINNIEKELKEQ